VCSRDTIWRGRIIIVAAIRRHRYPCLLLGGKVPQLVHKFLQLAHRAEQVLHRAEQLARKVGELHMAEVVRRTGELASARRTGELAHARRTGDLRSQGVHRWGE